MFELFLWSMFDYFDDDDPHYGAFNLDISLFFLLFLVSSLFFSSVYLLSILEHIKLILSIKKKRYHFLNMLKSDNQIKTCKIQIPMSLFYV